MLHQGVDFSSSASVRAMMAATKEAEERVQKQRFADLPKSVQERLIQSVMFGRARQALMTGPKATPPRASTVLRFLRQLHLGVPVNCGSRIGVRYPAEKGYPASPVFYLHPTKGWRGCRAMPHKTAA